MLSLRCVLNTGCVKKSDVLVRDDGIFVSNASLLKLASALC